MRKWLHRTHRKHCYVFCAPCTEHEYVYYVANQLDVGLNLSPYSATGSSVLILCRIVKSITRTLDIPTLRSHTFKPTPPTAYHLTVTYLHHQEENHHLRRTVRAVDETTGKTEMNILRMGETSYSGDQTGNSHTRSGPALCL